MCREGIDLPITTAVANVTSCLCSPDVLNNKAQSSKTCCAFYVLKRKKLRLDVKVRNLLYKNPIQIFFKLTVYIGKGGQKTNFTFNSISYTFDNQLFTVDIKNNF